MNIFTCLLFKKYMVLSKRPLFARSLNKTQVGRNISLNAYHLKIIKIEKESKT